MDPVEKGTKLVALLLLYSTSPAPSRPHPCRAHTAPITSAVGGCWGQWSGVGGGVSRQQKDFGNGSWISIQLRGRQQETCGLARTRLHG